MGKGFVPRTVDRFGGFAGIREVVFCCASGLGFLLLRWHPRFAFALASAFC